MGGPADSDALWADLLALPSGVREVLVLRYGQDRSEAEIAAVTGRSASDVAATARRGLASLGVTSDLTLRVTADTEAALRRLLPGRLAELEPEPAGPDPLSPVGPTSRPAPPRRRYAALVLAVAVAVGGAVVVARPWSGESTSATGGSTGGPTPETDQPTGSRSIAAAPVAVLVPVTDLASVAGRWRVIDYNPGADPAQATQLLISGRSDVRTVEGCGRERSSSVSLSPSGRAGVSAEVTVPGDRPGECLPDSVGPLLTDGRLLGLRDGQLVVGTIDGEVYAVLERVDEGPRTRPPPIPVADGDATGTRVLRRDLGRGGDLGALHRTTAPPHHRTTAPPATNRRP